jgi:hypothetical protein
LGIGHLAIGGARLMIPTEKIRQSVLLGREVPRASSTAQGGGAKSLITDEPWDRYDLESLLPLKEMIRETTEFGFLLRHYWIPATVLTFRQSSRTTLPDGTVQQCELQIERTMARCRSNECTWREKIRQVTPRKGDAQPFDLLISEKLCSYDCYDQTYVSAKPIVFALPTADEKLEARRQALYRLPMLVPPGPVPIGFTWYAKVGDDYMNFRLEAEHKIGENETSVLVIRREGRYTMWLPEETADSGSGKERMPVVTKRQGITLFACNRGAVLEDRFLDQIVEIGGNRGSDFSIGTTHHAVTHLVRSCPTNIENPVPSPTGKESG